MRTASERCELSVSELRWRCDPDVFSFQSTAEVPPLHEFVGQDRALRAIEFGLAVDRPGYNIFVTGLTGTGRASAIQAYLQRTVAARTAAENGHPVFDWCYVYNFEDSNRPVALRLPSGKGAELRTTLDNLVRRLKRDIARAFGEEQYETGRRKILEETQQRQQQLAQEMDAEARKQDFLLQFSPTDVALIPLIDGQPATQPQILALSEEQKAALGQRHAALMKMVGEGMQKVNSLKLEGAEKLAALDKGIVAWAVTRPFQGMIEAFSGLPEVTAYIEQVKAYTLDNVELFHEQAGQPRIQSIPIGTVGIEDPYLAYRVNLFVDNSRSGGLPIVIEHHPTFGNLFGRIERRPVMGGHVTDHRMLRPGALALANGGYLVANARDVFASPGVWDGLKRAIRNREVRPEDPAEALGLVGPLGLRPQPMPLDIKLVLLGDNALYRLVSLHDEDFWEMFKVKAEFDSQIERTAANMQVYASFVAACCESDKIAHFDRTGVAAALEHAARLVSNQHKLSARFGQIRDLLLEADHWAGQAGSPVVSAAHVRQAIAEKSTRVNLVQERIRDLVKDGVLLVNLEGEEIGQVNGLTVYDLGDISFGHPARITARTFAGRSGVVNIERESRLSGKIHDKGVLILSGYLGWRYAQSQSLSLSASLCFEQSYEGVDGDSASSAELYAILSCLARVPVRQGIAVTGSINQKGEMQAIGGVNEKIEGFFDVCRIKDPDGRHGVIIPRANVRHLMLREDVVAAVAEGRFRIFAVGHVDEGMEILTGIPMGVPAENGTYPERSISYRVVERLRELGRAVRGAEEDKKKNGEGECEKPGDSCPHG